MPSPIDISRILRPAIKSFHREQQADDDCSSTASTVLVDRFGKENTTATAKAKKYVHFSTEPSHYYAPTSNVLITPELIAECWYQFDEIQTFRQQVTDLSQHVLQVEKLNRAPYSYQRVLERTFEACQRGCPVVESHNNHHHQKEGDVLVASEKQHLQRWLDVADCRLGLERLCIQKIARDKTLRRVALQRLMRQEQRRRRGHPQVIINNNNNNLVSSSMPKNTKPPPDQDEFLRQECARYSQPSRVFARIMAEALAAVVQNSDRALLPTDIEFSTSSMGIEV